MSFIFSVCMFYLSFFPLWLSIVFIDIKSIIQNSSNLWTEWSSLICMTIGFVMSWSVLWYTIHTKSIGTHTFILKEAKEEKIISTEFLLSYVLPLFAFDFTKWDQVVLFLIFYITMNFLCIRHNYFSVNIVLEFLNYRFYNCVIENEDKIQIETRIISRNRLNILLGQSLNLKSINNEYRIDFSEEGDRGLANKLS